MSASTGFVPVNFVQGQLLDTDTMQQLVNNETDLHDSMVDAIFTSEGGQVVTNGVKLLCGKVYIQENGNSVVYGTVGFPSIFSPLCGPIITTGLSNPSEDRFELIVFGIGTIHPDYRGFQFKIKINPAYNDQTFRGPTYIHWIAMGF